MARPRISELFEQEPSRWGGRGDPYLWQEMAGQLADASWPASAAALERLLGETFERLSGHPLEYDALIYLARHALAACPAAWSARSSGAKRRSRNCSTAIGGGAPG